MVHDRQFLTCCKGEILGKRKLLLVGNVDKTLVSSSRNRELYDYTFNSSSFLFNVLQSAKRYSDREDTVYLKPRPGIVKFVESMADLYEIYIYTMAERVTEGTH